MGSYGGWGAALSSLGTSLPQIGASIDDATARKIKAQQEAESHAAQLAALAQSTANAQQENESRAQEMQTGAWKQSELEKNTAESDAKKAAAQDALGKYLSTLSDVKQAQNTSTANSEPTEEHRTGMGFVPDYAAHVPSAQPGYAGPISPDYQGKLGQLASKTPLEQMSEFQLPYHSASDPGIKNMTDEAEKEQARQEALAQAKALKESTLNHEYADLSERQRHDKEMEGIAATNAQNSNQRGAGALRGPGATALRVMQSNPDWKMQNSKVSQSIHAMNLIDGSTDAQGNINLNDPMAAELVSTVASLIGGGNSHTLEEYRAMHPQSLLGDIKSRLAYWTSSTGQTLPQNWGEALKHIVARQGLQSEKLRDNSSYQEGAVEAVTAGMNIHPEDQAQILDALKKYGPKFSAVYPNYVDLGTTKPGGATGTPGTWTSDKEKRLKELQAKKAAGQLK